MNIVINSVRFEASEQLKSFIGKKLDKLDRFFDGVIKAEVFLKVVKPESAQNKHVEIILRVPNNDIFVEKVADTFEEAFDGSFDVLKRQLSKHKEKIKLNK